MNYCAQRARSERRGTALVELALLLPFLVLLLVIAVDYARIFYFTQCLVNSARSGAVYGSSHPDRSTDTAGIAAMVQADLKNLPTAATVTSAVVTDADGKQAVSVTVSWTFKTLTSYPGVPASVALVRTVQIRIGALTPTEQ